MVSATGELKIFLVHFQGVSQALRDLLPFLRQKSCRFLVKNSRKSGHFLIKGPKAIDPWVRNGLIAYGNYFMG